MGKLVGAGGGKGCDSEQNVDEGGEIHGGKDNTGDVKIPECWEGLTFKRLIGICMHLETLILTTFKTKSFQKKQYQQLLEMHPKELFVVL